MKSSIKLSLAFVLSVSLFFSCSLLFLNAKADVSLEKLKISGDTIRIQTQEDSPVVDVQLIENTDQCFVDCHAILKIHPYENILLPSQPNSEFDWKFEKEKPWMDGLSSYHFEILETTEYKVEIPEYGKTLVNTTCYNEDNSTYECETEQTVQTGSHEETRYRDEYKPFAFWGETLKANQDYIIKLVGKKLPKLGKNNIDWIPTIKGLELNEWNWWNSSWAYRQAININATQNVTEYQILLNVNSANNGTHFNYTEACEGKDRFTDELAVELNYTTSFCNGSEVNFVVRGSFGTDNGTQAYMYYGNSLASDARNPYLTYDMYEDFHDGTFGNWTKQEGSPDASLGYLRANTSADMRVSRPGTGFNESQNKSWSFIINRPTATNWQMVVGMISPTTAHVYTGFWVNNDKANDYLANATSYVIANLNSLAPLSNETWHTFTVTKYNGNFTLIVDGTRNSSINTGLGSAFNFVQLYTAYGVQNQSFDNITVSKWLEPWPSVILGAEDTPCPSDNTYINQSTKFEAPNKFCNMDDESPEGVLIINESNIILDCNDMTLNGSGGGSGIYNDGFENVTIKNCKVQNYNNGIALYSVTSDTEENKLYNNTLTLNNKGLTLWNGAFKTIISENNMSSNNNYGIYIFDYSEEGIDHNNTLINSIMKSNGIYDAYVAADDYVFFVNTTYDTENVSDSNLIRQWYVKANVTDKNMAPIQNAQVTVKDKFNSTEWTENTTSSGLTNWNIVTQYIHNQTGIYNYMPHNISGYHSGYPSNFTVQNITESRIVHLLLKFPLITFNVTSGEDDSPLDNVNINCNYTGFNQNDTTNPYGPYEFTTGWWSCTFEKTLYFNKTITFIADSDKMINISLSLSGFLSGQEHTWLEKLYNCLYLGNDADCSALQFFNQINQSTTKTWNQFKRTDQSIVASEIITNKTVSQNSNLTINYSVNVPIKEGFTFGETSGEVRLDYLPIRLSYWFLNSNNLTCYSQGNYSVALADPYCQPLTVYTIGQVNTNLNFTVSLRPSLPSGNYTIVRNIEIDPQQVWIDYGQEIIGQVEISEDNKESYVNVKNSYILPKMIDKSNEQIVVKETSLEEKEEQQTDKTTGMVTVNQVDTLSYTAVIVSVITLVLVGLMYKNSSKRSPWGY